MDFPSALAILASPGGHAVPRAEAESIVQAVVNDPSRGIQALCHALECDGRDDLGTRRLAAVLLSTAAARHWSVLGDDAKAAMRQRTLAALSRAEDRAEMRALVHAADTLASRSADDGSPWHELLPALDDAAKSARATHREAAVILLGSIVESTGAHMNDHHAALVALFAARLDDPVREVAAAATRALGTTALALQRRGDFLVVADLLPRILTACVDAAARRLDRSDDEAVAVATDAIAAAASVDCDVAFGSDASLLPRVVDVLVGIGTDPRLHPDGRARAAAFDALGCLAASHPGLLDEPRPTAAGRGTGTGTGTAVTAPTTTLADEIVPRLCAAAAAAGVDFTAAGRAEGEAESGGFAAAARSTLRRFSLHLPPAVVLPHVVAPLDAALLAGAAPSPGALACLAAVTEGCASDLAEDPIASNVIASVAAAMESPDPGSKVAAVVAFKELAEHAGHALTELYSHAVIPTLVAAIRLAVEHETEGGRGDAAESFVAPAHASAGALCANFGSDEIAPALPGVIPPLLGGALGGWRRGEDGARGIRPRGMDRAPRTNPRVRARCLDTLERFARAAAFEFEPFASDVVATLATLATTNGGGGGTDDRDDDASHAGRVDREGVAAVRFRSLAAMATVIAAVGEESAPPGAVDSILSSATLALSAGSSEDAVARECAFRCFGRLATVLERSLAPWLGGAIASAAATLAEAEARGGFQPAVSTGDAGESIAAAEALGALVNSCGFATRPHLAVALAALGRAASSPSSPVALRIAAARSLEFSLRPLEEADDGGGGGGDGHEKSAPGDGDGYEKSAPGDGDDAAAGGGARDLAAETVALLARLVTEDEEPEVALAAATSLEESAAAGRRLGAAAAAATTAAAAAALLDGSARCQAGLAEGEGGDDGEDAGTVFFDLEDQARRLKKSLG